MSDAIECVWAILSQHAATGRWHVVGVAPTEATAHASTDRESLRVVQVEPMPMGTRKSLAHVDDALDRLRTIVDEAFGMHPVLGWEELLDVLEAQIGETKRRNLVFREAVHHLHLAIPPDRLVVEASRSPTVRQAISIVTTGKE